MVVLSEEGAAAVVAIGVAEAGVGAVVIVAVVIGFAVDSLGAAEWELIVIERIEIATAGAVVAEDEAVVGAAAVVIVVGVAGLGLVDLRVVLDLWS